MSSFQVVQIINQEAESNLSLDVIAIIDFSREKMDRAKTYPKGNVKTLAIPVLLFLGELSLTCPESHSFLLCTYDILRY